LIDVINRYDERMSIKNGRLVRTIDDLGDKVVAQSGFTVISRNTGQKIIEFEYSQNSLDNLLGCIFRHNSPRQEPDPECLRSFGEMTQRYLSDLTNKMLNDGTEEIDAFINFPRKHEEWG